MNSTRIDEGPINTINATRKDTASRGGEARANKFQEIINEAYRLEKEMRPPINGWKSRRQAVLAILEKVQAFARERNQPLSGDQASTTIDNWLKTMPDAALVFPKQKNSQHK